MDVSTPTEFPTTVADLIERLEGISPHRIRLHPAPGTAREGDVVAVHDREGRLCELVDGVLVEKVMGYYESRVAAILIQLLGNFLHQARLGIVAGADGMMKLAAGLVRIPDVSFVSWSRLPDGRVPRAPIPSPAPDLAVEVLSEGNTQAEMRRKVSEYFAAGTRQVWLVHTDPPAVEVFSSMDRSTRLEAADTIDGGDVLPGFSLSIRDWFERVERG